MRRLILAVLSFAIVSCASSNVRSLTLDCNTPVDQKLQGTLESIDSALRAKYGIESSQVDLGLLDLKRGRVAMIHPNQIEYAASVAKVGILLAYFELHREAATSLDAQTRHELGLMIKVSSNEMAAKYSRQMGLQQIQNVLNSHGFYDRQCGGGLWVGKHYGPKSERIGDPIADHSHAVTVRQLLRFYLLLEQGKLVSPKASRTMKEIFRSPELRHDDLKFVRGLAGRDLSIMRKWGSWQDWLHDSAVIEGPSRHYVLVGLTHHPRGDEYLTDLAQAVDDAMTPH